jgi:hypothetical protein
MDVLNINIHFHQIPPPAPENFSKLHFIKREAAKVPADSLCRLLPYLRVAKISALDSGVSSFFYFLSSLVSHKTAKSAFFRRVS